MLQAFTEDEVLLAHSADVTVLSLLLGLSLENYLIEQRRRLNCRQARDVTNLALGALFHDIGNLVLPPAQREPGITRGDTALDDASAAWRQHTDEGYAVVRGRLDPSAAVVVQHHHQRFDGTGFGGAEGRGLAGEQIHVFARIVMAADLFCRTHFMGSNLPQPMVKTLWQLQQVPLRNAFDPVIHRALMQMFPPFVEGMTVMLADGRQAVVSRMDADYPCYPDVQPLQPSEEDGGEVVSTVNARTAIAVVDATTISAFLYGPVRGHFMAA